MIRWIVESSLQSRNVVVAIAAALTFFGMSQLRDLPLDLLPEFTPPSVEIQIESLGLAGGLSAAEMEALMVVPLEAGLVNEARWLKDIRSETVPGMASIQLTFEPGIDLLDARQVAEERLAQGQALPNVSEPPVLLQPVASTSRVMKVGLTSKKLSLLEMSLLARWTIQPRLMGVHGVANVSIWGQRQWQYQVQVDPARLHAKNVTLDQIVSTAGNALWVSPLSFLIQSAPGAGGWIETPNQRLLTRHQLPIRRANDLAQVIIEGTTLSLGDVADVVEGHQPLIGDAIIGDGPGLLFVIEKLPWANTLEVTRGVERMIETLRPGLAGIEFDSEIYRPATFIQRAADNLAVALLVGLGLVVLVVGVFLYQWRTALISLVAILLSVLAAGLVLYLRGATMNMMVFAGLLIALGAIVDDAIIDLEHIVRRLREHRAQGSDKPAARIILEGALEMRSPIVFATLVLVVAVAPFFFVAGVSGAFFTPLASSYLLAVLTSLLVALTITPALSLMLLRNAPLKRGDSPLVRRLRGGYEAALARTVQTSRPVGTYLVVGAIVLAGLAVLPTRWQPALLPSFQDTDLLIRLEGAPGLSHPEIDRIAHRMGRELRSIPGVRNVGAQLGRAVTGDQVVGMNSFQLWVHLNPASDYAATVASIQEVVDGYPGLSGDVLTYPETRLKKVQTGTPDHEMLVRVYGHDSQVLRRKATEVAQALAKIDGVVGARVERQVEEPTIEVEVDLAAAKHHRLKPGDIRRQVAYLVSGVTAGSIYEEQKVFDVVVLGTPKARHSLSGVHDLLIETPDGGRVRLQDVAKVRVVPSVSVIKRVASSRYLDVGFAVSGRNLDSVALDVERRLKGIHFPLEHRAELLAGYRERQAERQRLLGLAVIAAIGILCLLQASFGSARLACVVFLTLPMAVVGGLLLTFGGAGIPALGALGGCLAVWTIAVRNGITLINCYRHLERHAGAAFGRELVVRGAGERFGPTLMTATATGVAFLPFLLFGDAAGLEMVRPMAVVTLGGLVTATLFNLFVMPAFYLRFGASSEDRDDVLEGEGTSALQHG